LPVSHRSNPGYRGGQFHRSQIPRAEVHKRQPEDDEIQHLLSLPIAAESLRTFLLNHHGNISATGEPNLILYGRWKFGVTWYEDVMQQLTHMPS
jgi:hypothetical protein